MNGTRKMAYAKELVDLVFKAYGLEKSETPRETVNYVVPYVSTQNLVVRKLIRVTKRAPFKFKTEDEDEKIENVGQSAELKEAAATDDGKKK